MREEINKLMSKNVGLLSKIDFHSKRIMIGKALYDYSTQPCSDSPNGEKGEIVKFTSRVQSN